MFNIKKLSPEQKILRKKIIDISHNHHVSHLGSCLSAIDLVFAIYEIKSEKDRFVLSSGHAGVALYAVLEYKKMMKIDQLSEFTIHPDRNPDLGIEVSTGSLGQGLPIALGMALSNREKKIFCLISDGEATEGSIWESLRIAQENTLSNLTIIVNANGWGAYSTIDVEVLLKRIHSFIPSLYRVNGHDLNKIKKTLIKSTRLNHSGPSVIFADTTVEQFPFLNGQDAHYYVMDSDDYDVANKLLKI